VGLITYLGVNVVIKVEATGLRLFLVVAIFGVAFGVASLLERLWRTYVPTETRSDAEPTESSGLMQSQRTIIVVALAICFALAVAGEFWQASQSAQRPSPSLSYWQQYSDYCAAEPTAKDKWRHDFWCEFKVTDFVIAIFSVVLAVATAGLMYLGMRQIRLARDEFISSNRPRIRLKHIWLATPDGQRFFGSLQSTTPITVRLDIVNNGNTTGFIRTINFVTLIVPDGQRLPQRPPYNQPGNPQLLLNDFALKSGITFTQAVSDGRTLSGLEVIQIQASSQSHRLYFIGTIEYWWGTDKDHLRQTAFCRFLSGPSERFEKDEDPDYEYGD